MSRKAGADPGACPCSFEEPAASARVRNGAAGHPAWLYNLVACPDRVEIELEGRKTAVTPQTLTGEDRAAAWERIARERPNFAGYEQKTDREIPVVRLVAR